MAAMALTELTKSHFRGYVRKDESWPEDSEQILGLAMLK